MVTGLNDIDEMYDRMALIRRARDPNVSKSVAGVEPGSKAAASIYTSSWRIGQ